MAWMCGRLTRLLGAVFVALFLPGLVWGATGLWLVGVIWVRSFGWSCGPNWQVWGFHWRGVALFVAPLGGSLVFL